MIFCLQRKATGASVSPTMDCLAEVRGGVFMCVWFYL